MRDIMSEKMNDLFIITDQQRADHIGCAGNSDLKTPNLDRLAAEGIRFTNAYVANPICMPNRSTIFTGKYPSIHGVRCNGINLDPDIPTLTQTLLENGYHTCSIGKIHLNFYGTPFKRQFDSAEQMIPFLFTPKDKRKPFPKPYYGLEEVELTIGHGDSVSGHYLDWIEERAPEYLEVIKHRAPRLFHEVLADSPIPEEIYHTTYITEQTISFLKRFSDGYYGDKPFFLHCSFPDPHHPVCPPGKYKTMYDPDKVELPPSLNDTKPLYKNPMHPYTLGLLNSMPKLSDNPDVPLNAIEGTPPDLKLTGNACNYHNRCPYAKDICRSEVPEIIEVEKGHFVACHFQTKSERLDVKGDEL